MKLNVGGHLFETTRETLTKYQNTYFSAQLSGNYATNNVHGTIFIDRDPEYFAVILNFLRTGKTDRSGLSEESLYEEAQYYGLEKVMFNGSDQGQESIEIEETAVFPLDKNEQFVFHIEEYWSSKNEMLRGSVVWICDGGCEVTIGTGGIIQEFSTKLSSLVYDMKFEPARLLQGDTTRALLFERRGSMRLYITDVVSDPTCSGTHSFIMARTKDVDAACVRTKKSKRESE